MKNRKSLAGIRALRELSREALANVEKRCSWHDVPPRFEIIGYQDVSNDVFFVVEGQVKIIIYSSSGKAVTFRTLQAGEMFGELSAIDDHPRSASVEAISRSLIAKVTGQAFWDVIGSEPAVTRAVLIHLVGLIRSLSTRVYEFSTLAVQNRIHAELLRLARDGVPAGTGVLIAKAPTHSDIASRISTHREAVAREFSRLAKLHLVQRHGAGLLITDLNRLGRMVAEATEE
jgi:CRP/FNR family transcriptional regulator, cyclic AMP receptor protein